MFDAWSTLYPDDLPIGNDMDMKTADFYCGLWDMETVLRNLAVEQGFAQDVVMENGVIILKEDWALLETH